MPGLARFLCLSAAIAFPAVLLTGCGPGYMLRGKVIPGDASFITIVEPDDPRLDLPGLPAAAVHLEMDPGRLHSETIAEAMSDADGSFALPVDRFGAGWLEYEVGLSVHKPGYTPTELPFELPPDDRVVLVTLMPGPDDPIDPGVDEQRLLEEVDQYYR